MATEFLHARPHTGTETGSKYLLWPISQPQPCVPQTANKLEIILKTLCTLSSCGRNNFHDSMFPYGHVVPLSIGSFSNLSVVRICIGMCIESVTTCRDLTEESASKFLQVPTHSMCGRVHKQV